jgi:hypothetical protein
MKSEFSLSRDFLTFLPFFTVLPTDLEPEQETVSDSSVLSAEWSSESMELHLAESTENVLQLAVRTVFFGFKTVGARETTDFFTDEVMRFLTGDL